MLSEPLAFQFHHAQKFQPEVKLQPSPDGCHSIRHHPAHTQRPVRHDLATTHPRLYTIPMLHNLQQMPREFSHMSFILALIHTDAYSVDPK